MGHGVRITHGWTAGAWTDPMPMPLESLAVFAVNASRAFGEAVARALGVALGVHEEREFEDGEHKIRPLESVRGRDVYVIQSLYADPAQSANDKLMRLLFFLGALRDAGAARLTAVMPYLAYARKDRRSQTRDPVTTRYVAQFIEAVGVDRVVTLEVHNLVAYQNAFRCESVHLDADRVFAGWLAGQLAAEAEAAVISPDLGGIKRAERFRQVLARASGREPAAGYFDKARAKGVLTLGRLTGEVRGRTAIIVDDLISSGSTMMHAARVCREQGARRVLALAAHGLFTGKAGELLADPALDGLIVTDSVPPFRLQGTSAAAKLTVLSVAGLFAEAIRRLHTGGSIVELLEG
jgi:ribose-phosphate pyrophosphokinase